MKRPVYKLVIDEDGGGMDFVGLVDFPAHEKKYITMSSAPEKVEQHYNFNEEKQIVTGVAIATDLLIYRRDASGFEYDVYFTKEETLKMMKYFAKRGFHNNVNLMHDMDQKVNDVYLIEAYFINDEMSNIPEAFKSQNLRPGSLIFSYWVEGAKTWEFVKSKGMGYSIEGWFKEVEVKFLKTKQSKMSEKLTLKERLFGKKEPIAEKAKFDAENKDKYAEVQTVDGNTIMFEEPIIEGETPLFVVPAEEGEEPILAPAGEHAYEAEGVVIVLTVDENGVITNVEETEADGEGQGEELEEALQEMKAQYEAKLAEQKAEFEAKLATTAEAFDKLEEAFEKLQEGKTSMSSNNVPGWQKLKG